MMGFIWFWLVAVMIVGYVVLDGFDLGVGVLHLFLVRTEAERRATLNSIGPVWDGNEVWLLAAGGTLYFAFPALYASSFSGFYLPLTMVLWLLMLRGIGIELRTHLDDKLWKSFFDAIFALERSINGLSPEQRVAARRKDIAPLVNDLIEWMKRERAKLSRHNEVAKAMDYMLKRIDIFTRFLEDGRICLSNNAAERALRGIALGRKSWLFAGSDRGGERAAVMLTLIHTAKLNDIDPQAWLADVLARIADHKITDLAALLPWNWRHAMPVARAA